MPPYSSHFSQVLKGTGYGFSGKLVGSLLQFGFIIYLTRNLSLTRVGYYFIGLSVFHFIHTFTIGGLDYAARKYFYISADKNNLIKLFIKRWFKKLIFIYSALCIFYLIGIFIPTDTVKIYTIVGFIVAAPIAAVVAVGTAVLQGMKRISLATLLKDITVPLLQLLIVGLLLTLGYGLIGAVAGYFLTYAILAVAVLFLLKFILHGENVASGPEQYQVSYNEINNYSTPMMYISIINLSVIWGTTLILGFLSTPEEVSLYSVTSRVATLSGLFIMSVNVIFEPIISELFHQNKHKDLIRIYQQTTNIMLVIMILITLVGSAFAENIMTLFGADYANAQLLLIIILIGQLVGVCAGPAGNILIMTGYQKISFYINLVIALAVIVLNILFIPMIGVIAAGISVGLGLAARNTVALVYLYLKTKVSPFNTDYWFVLIPAFGGLIGTVLFRNSPTGYIIAGVFTIGYSIYIVKQILNLKVGN